MKQPKKKQPINVQLSKDDLKELLVVLKNFIQEDLRATIQEQVLAEFAHQSQRLFLNSSENAKGISRIVDRETRNAATISKKFTNLETQIHCGVTTGHYFTVIHKLTYGYRFRCANCELEYIRANDSLTKKEIELVTAVYGKVENENSEIRS